MRTPFEEHNILIEPGLVRLVNRVLEFMFPPSYCILSQEPDIWEQFEVPQYHEDDPARPLGYHESGAKLVKRGTIDASCRTSCTRASVVGRDS